VRFLVGLAESAFYPGMQYVIGSWYRKDELAKRSCIFHTSSALGTMFSGYLMAAVYHLGGKGGYKGWQWYESLSSGFRNYANHDRLFIVDGIISLPIALAGFFILPDVPEITRVWYLSEEVCVAHATYAIKGLLVTQEKQFARQRMAYEGRENRQPYTKAKFKKILTSWHIYLLSLLYV
jgi:ACS family pantothenate transporter-like MFS transporter